MCPACAVTDLRLGSQEVLKASSLWRGGVALGMTPEGRKEVIDFMIGRGESQGAWKAFLYNLYRRGLDAEGFQMFITEGVFLDRTNMERILYAVFSFKNSQRGTGTPFLVLTQNW